MNIPISKNLRKLALISSLFLTAIVSASANAASVYNFVITDGLINTSGGITGDGLGTLAVNGTFTATFTDTAIQFSDINVITNPDSSFVFPSYDGVFDGFFFSGSQIVSLLGIDDVYSGVFDGANFNIVGLYSEPFLDGYQYEYSIIALGSPVPVPGAFLLFISGLGFLVFKRHKLIS